jgi:ribosomal-protein-alanine N-acetyltransferase
VTLTDGRIGLRPIKQRDRSAWLDVRARNAAWLRPWDATNPEGAPIEVPSFSGMVRLLNAEARAGRVLPFILTWDGDLVGQVTVGGITYGSLRAAHVGYWVDQRVAGRGVTPTGVALAVDHCFGELQLHRIEVNIRPENKPSLRVVEKLGFRFEGLRPRYLHIDGDWRDHNSYALHAEEVRGGVLQRWKTARAQSS